jgi:hypothetical protein
MADLGSVTLLILANKDFLSGAKGSDVILFATGAANTTSDLTTNNPIIKIVGPVTLFVLIIASIFASFLLLAFEWKKAQQIIKSRGWAFHLLS